MNQVNEYINQFNGEKKDWLATFVTFMRENYPEINETISYQMPMFKFNGTYIAFSVAKDHFSFHTLDFDMIERLKGLLPNARFGKGCAKVKFKDKVDIPILFDICKTIVDRSKMESKG